MTDELQNDPKPAALETDLDKVFGTDKALEEQGAWIEFLPGVRFKIARNTTARFKQRIHAAYRPYQVLMNSGEGLPAAVEPKVNSEVIADTLLMAWEGVTFRGEAVPFERTRVIALLMELPDLRNWIWQQADSAANYRRKMLEQEGKDSST